MKLFLNACGLPDDLRLRVEDKTRNETTFMTFPRPYVVIGRSADCDLVLDHWQVSRRHCYLQFIEGRLFCLDLGSRTGTRWDGPVARWKWLDRDQWIMVGPQRIQFEPDEESIEPPRLESDSTPLPLTPLPGARIQSADDAEEDEDWRLNDLITLMGRSPACHIRVSDQNVSKFHASLIHTPMGVWIIDLLGIGGVTVNRTRVRCARLSQGDEFLMGNHRYRITYDDPEAMTDIVDDEPYEAASKEVVPYGRGMNLPGFAPPTGLPMMPNAYGHVIDAEQLPESVAIAQALLAPMMQQFSMMQQQMFENFHQMMMTMMQSMQVMHRDHMDLVNRELDEVRRITRELHALQAEALKSKDVAPPPPTATAPDAPAKKHAARPSASNPPGGSSRSVDPKPERHQASPPPKSAPQKRAEPTPPPASDPKESRAASSGPRERARPFDTHTQIQQRILNLQNERQSRWQKILSMVGGGDGRS